VVRMRQNSTTKLFRSTLTTFGKHLINKYYVFFESWRLKEKSFEGTYASGTT
jgi:hypothetical protein